MDTEPPVIQAYPLPQPSQNLTKYRLLRSRGVSTPIRNVPIDEVSVQLQNADISEIV